MDQRAEPLSTRRDFLGAMGCALALGAIDGPFAGVGDNAKPLNIMLITADDLNCDSLACYGGALKDLTPNIDALARQGMRFERAHVNVGICMPSRIALATGLYGHNSGAMGFMHAHPGTANVVDLFQGAGYAAGLFGKADHSTACADVVWDYVINKPDLGDGRNPDKYAQHCADFLNQCKQDKKPFYMMVNAHDPHRPFQKPGNPSAGAARPSKYYQADEIAVPGFLPDLPGVREEMSHYINSVRRLDDTVGAVLKTLQDSGYADNTLVMFISDNGIAMPFAKCNCYLAGTRTPWIVRWPKVVKPNSVNKDDFISGIDFLPSILEAADLPKLPQQDGRSFVSLLKEKKQDNRDWVFTQIDSKAGDGYVPMRCVQNDSYGYIFNPWSNGKATYKNNNEGMAMKAMEAAAQSNPAIAERVKLFRSRCLEELYDLKKDPDCLHNLIDDAGYATIKQGLFKKMEEYMQNSSDSLFEGFKVRYDGQALMKAMNQAKRSGSNIQPVNPAKIGRKNV